MQVAIKSRLGLKEVAFLLSVKEDKLRKILKGEESSKNWKNFKLSEHGKLLVALLFAGALEKELEIDVFNLLNKYRNRIFPGYKIREFRKTFVEEVNRNGFTVAVAFGALAEAGRVMIMHSKDCKLAESLFKDVELGVVHSVRKAEFDKLHLIYCLVKDIILPTRVSIVELLNSENSIYEVAVPYLDMIRVGLALKLCISSFKKMNAVNKALETYRKILVAIPCDVSIKNELETFEVELNEAYRLTAKKGRRKRKKVEQPAEVGPVAEEQ